MKFLKISEYMDIVDRYIPEDSGEVLTQPNLSLSVKDILERWQRDMPLDIITRNGSYMLPPDIEPDDDDYETEDLDRMDPVDAAEYMERRQQRATATHTRTSKSKEATELERSGGEGATEASEDE